MPHHQAILVNHPGGPETLTYTQIATPTPGRGELLVDVAVAGVNFMDTGTRTGQNGPGPFPVTPGVEGAGRVLALGDGVTDFEMCGTKLSRPSSTTARTTSASLQRGRV